jgi:YcxB-like protein
VRVPSERFFWLALSVFILRLDHFVVGLRDRVLVPAVKLRLSSLRLQISDDGPLLGPTRLIIEPDGLVVDRKVVTSKYQWAAFRAVEIAKNALILPIDNGIGLIIPASAFATEAERYEFAALISKRLETGAGSR